MDDQFLKVAKQAALEAGKIISKYAGKIHTVSVKNDDASDFATEADLESEQKIIQILTRNFPHHNIIAEEGGQTKKDSEYTWVIDSVDGTFSFAVGVPYYSVSIGLLKNAYPILGVIYNIAIKQLYWGRSGKGAYLNGKKIHVSSRNRLDQAAGSLDLGHRQKRQQKIDKYVTPLITKIAYPYSFGSAVATLGMVAQGILDMYVNEAWIWDFAAGTVIVREAGGKVTNFAGQEPDWSKDIVDIVASNGLVHDAILEALSTSLRGTK